MQIARLLSGFVLLSSLLLQSCQQEPLRITAEEEYIREFYKTFKNVDPDHDWNLAQKSTVTVKTSVPSSIRVLADVKGTRYLFADYKDAQGTTEIPVTLPKGVSDIIVSVNGQNFPSTLGATVDATSAKSRIIAGSEDHVSTLDGIDWKIEPATILPTTAVSSHINNYPEGQENLLKGVNSFYFIADGEEHTFYPFYWNTNAHHALGIYTMGDDGYAVPHDLYYTKSGELSVSTDYREKIEETISYKIGETRLFAEKSDEAIKNGITDINNNTFDNPNWWTLCGIQQQQSAIKEFTSETKQFLTPHGYISKIEFLNWGNTIHFYETFTEDYSYTKVIQEANDGTWTKPTNQNQAYAPGENTYIKTRGITYKLPKGTMYGFYIKVSHSGTITDISEAEQFDYDYVCFSHSERNQRYKAKKKMMTYIDGQNIEVDVNWRIRENPWPKEKWTPTEPDENFVANPLNAYAYASWSTATMHGKKYTIFGFEDCAYGYYKDPCDLNDVMFLFEAGEEPSNVHFSDKDPEPEEPYTWIIAAEDLGGSFDWDFNDLVAEVQLLPVSEDDKEYTKVTVKPLASGGFRPVYLMYTGKIYDKENATETDEKNYVVGGEFHSLFGGSHGNPINVSKGQKKQAGEIVFYTPKGHTMAKPHDRYDKDNPNMGGFWVLSCEENKPLSGISATKNLQVIETIPDGQGINQVGAPDSNKELTSPQIMCLETGWRWPLENKDIRHAYTTFEEWVKDKTKTDWVNTYNEEHLIDEY